MFERYHVPIKLVQNRAPPVPKFVIIRASNCVNCGKCERACIYGVHKRDEKDPRKMADPINQLCKNCFRCIDECPQRSLSMAQGPEYKSLGRGIWTPLRISTMWSEAETGRIPVFGAGYRGMFAGPGYDGMWTDMSEIVRPTRDGIHGREYISTSVDIGSKPSMLEFDISGTLKTKLLPNVELPLPVVIDVVRLKATSETILKGLAQAAKHLDTLMIAVPQSLPKDASAELNSHLVPFYGEDAEIQKIALPPGVRMVELGMRDSWKDDVMALRARFPETVLAVRVSAGRGIEQRVLEAVRAKVDAVHLLFDEDGVEESGSGPRHAKETLRAVHKALVSKAVRDQITIISGGGIAAAEHVPKTIICGADVVGIEKALLIALECRDCIVCSKGSCPIGLHSSPSDWVEGRVMNMVGAWRDQLLEVLGAMGLREVRRLRGEIGRAIFYEDVEREAFSGISGGASSG